jgi:hypothetical protein
MTSHPDVLLPVKVAGTINFGAPEGWDEQLNGECRTLPVRIDHDSNVYQSFWKLTWRQWLGVLFGRKICLSIHGMQPPVRLNVEKVAAST